MMKMRLSLNYRASFYDFTIVYSLIIKGYRLRTRKVSYDFTIST